MLTSFSAFFKANCLVLMVVNPMDNEKIKIGIIEYWNNEAAGLKEDQDALNEFYRQFPRTEEHAFRDEAKRSIFNLAVLSITFSREG